MPTVHNLEYSLNMPLRMECWVQSGVIDGGGQLAVCQNIYGMLMFGRVQLNGTYELTSITSDRAGKMSVDGACKTVMPKSISRNTTRTEVLR